MTIDNQWGYAIVRGGWIVATELTLALAERWLFSEIIPLCPVSERNDIQLEAEDLNRQLDNQGGMKELLRLRVEKLEQQNETMLAALIECDEAMDYMSEYDIPLCLPDRVKAAIAKAKPDHFRDATKMIETSVPAIIFFPAGSLGEEITP